MVLSGVVVLAGGHSKRMGSPKALLTLPTGELLLDYHVRQASKLNVPIMIADNGRGFSVDKKLIDSAHVFHIADYVSANNNESSENDDKRNYSKQDSDTGGALVAIEAALQALNKLSEKSDVSDKKTSWLLVISCDSLVPAIELWQHLSFTDNLIADDKAVVCLSDDNHLYPLLGLYRLSIEPELKSYINSDQRRVMRFVEPISLAVSISSQWRNLTNFNTPLEFRQACDALFNQ